MGLISIEDLEAATGTDISVSDEPKYQWYIDAVSNYVIEYCSEDFELHEDVELICQADGRGIIEFPNLAEVTKVEYRDDWYGTYEEIISGWYRYDGFSKIKYLEPRQTYRVTVTYGYESVPESVKNVVTQLVLAGSGLDLRAAGGISSYRIGDKEIEYGVTSDDAGMPVVTLAGFQRAVLDKYGLHTTTWRL